MLNIPILKTRTVIYEQKTMITSIVTILLILLFVNNLKRINVL